MSLKNKNSYWKRADTAEWNLGSKTPYRLQPPHSQFPEKWPHIVLSRKSNEIKVDSWMDGQMDGQMDESLQRCDIYFIHVLSSLGIILGTMNLDFQADCTLGWAEFL